MRSSEFITELSLPKGEWTSIHDNEKQEVSGELIDLVKTAYASTSMGSFINSPDDLDASDWIALDWDEEDDVDSTIFYRRPRGNEPWRGFKLQGLGHDGQSQSKGQAIDYIQYLVSKPGWWIEASDALRSALLGRGCRAESDVNLLRQLFNDPTLTMHDDITYTRTLSDGKRLNRETVFGRPVLK